VNPIACSRIGVARSADNRPKDTSLALDFFAALVSLTAATCVKNRLARQVRRGGRGEVNRAKRSRSFTHVAAVDETKAGNSRAEGHLFRRLSAPLATPIREHAIGFTLCGDRFKIYVMAACGVFVTNSRTVTEENGELSTFSTVSSKTVIG
ncbi:hypothetical protein MVLG_07287, partial [Microbotryum lychnidis-dioicae p1A1 Lamole]